MAVVNQVTAIPGPRSRELLARWHEAEYDSTGYQASVVWETGRGVTVTDVDGNRYLDWTSGVLVTNVGHCHPKLVAAVQSAAGKLLNNYECPTENRIRAAEALVEALPDHLDRCFFLTTGSEATEAAMRLMKRKTGRFEIVGVTGGFHGRTSAAAAAGGLAGPKRGYGPTVPGMIRVPFPYAYRCPFGSTNEAECAERHLDWLDGALGANSAGSLAGLIVEPYLGAAGFIFPPEGYLKRLEAWARSHDMLVTVDEVQSSYGRTGAMWAHEAEGLTPDILCIGKGIGSGIPASAVAASEAVFSCLGKGEMSSTSGGNPVSSAAVEAVLEIIREEDLCANARRIGGILMTRLRQTQERCAILGDVRGRGMVLGLELVRDKGTKEPAPDLTKAAIDRCAEKGLLIGSVGIFGNVIRVAPPLVMTEAEAHESCDIMDEVLRGLAG